MVKNRTARLVLAFIGSLVMTIPLWPLFALHYLGVFMKCAGPKLVDFLDRHITGSALDRWFSARLNALETWAEDAPNA